MLASPGAIPIYTVLPHCVIIRLYRDGPGVASSTVDDHYQFVLYGTSNKSNDAYKYLPTYV